jgi:hypothetical protein
VLMFVIAWAVILLWVVQDPTPGLVGLLLITLTGQVMSDSRSSSIQRSPRNQRSQVGSDSHKQDPAVQRSNRGHQSTASDGQRSLDQTARGQRNNAGGPDPSGHEVAVGGQAGGPRVSGHGTAAREPRISGHEIAVGGQVSGHVTAAREPWFSGHGTAVQLKFSGQ